MRYFISDESENYIKNKFHDTSKPFDPMNRFTRNDDYFDESTGLSPDEIKKGIDRLDDESLSHPLRKAKAFEYILKNTRIACDEKDRFPAINMLDLPLHGKLVRSWEREIYLNVIPETKKKMDDFYDRIANLIPDYCHSVPDWERLIDLGFYGILNECIKIEDELKGERTLTKKEEDFFESIIITYKALIDFTGRLSCLAMKNEKTKRMGLALASLTKGAPKTFYEALLLSFLYFILCEHIEGLHVRSLAHFDRIYYPFFKRDLDNGEDIEELKKDLAFYIFQFACIGHPQNYPITFGGSKENGDSEINELSYVFLEVYDKMNLFCPKIQIKVTENIPKDYLMYALEMVRHGHNSILFMSDKCLIGAGLYDGATKKQARLIQPKGCAEFSVVGAMDVGMNYVNMLKPLEFAMHQGKDGITGTADGLQCKPVNEYKSFEEFFEEYKRQLAYVFDNVIEITNSYEKYLSEINPQNMFAGTNEHALRLALSPLEGGAVTNNSDIEGGAFGDLIDSLYMIKKYVFDKKELTFIEFKNILDANFTGYEKFRNKILSDTEKYCNNKQGPDAIAKEFLDFIAEYQKGKTNIRGGKFHIWFHVSDFTMRYGDNSLATPNGRLLGEETSRNISPKAGQNREGATSAILTAVKYDWTRFHGNNTLDIAFLPSTVSGEDGKMAMYGLVMTFVKRGGFALNINVLDSGILRDAQINPDKYKDLQIRVCGWNVLFNNLPKIQQENFIKQAEGLM